MAYKIHFEDITNVQREVSTTITGWADALASIESAMSQFMSDSALQGQALNGMKSYLAEVHYPIILVLGTLMQDYSASLLLYKDGYYNIDDASKAKLPEQNLTTLKSDLEGSRNNLQNQLDLLSTEKAKINDILTYRGMSHTTTIMKYNALINDLNRLHQSIAQYESQHTMQDLVPFKELLASTKRLLASYGSQSRNVGSYQPGSIGQLQQMQEVAAAYSNAVNHLSNRTDRIKTAQERDAVRWEAIAAEERRNQGVLNFVVGALTVVGGVVAIVATAGAATPLVVAAGATLGTGTALYGYSNMIEAEQDIIYGSLGDTKSFAVNPIRDTIFLGNNQLYHQTGQIFSIGSSIIAPIGQAGSIGRGLAQFGGGALGAWGGGELGYHGAKLLGASDSQANAAKFLTSMAGASAGSSLAGKFSLNKLTTKKVPEQVPPYNKEQILKNIEASKLARENSNFSTYLEIEKFTKKVSNINYIDLSEELGKELMDKGYKIVSIQDAQLANADWAELGFDLPPIAKGTKAYFIEAGDTQYARVFKDGKNYPVSRFILDKAAIKDLTAEQISEKYALPFIPDRVVNVELPPDTILEVSIAGPQKTWGTVGGDVQYAIKTTNPNTEWFKDISKLP